LVAGLGHDPSPAEAALVEQASYLIVQSRRLRIAGKPATECSRLLTRVLALLYGRDGGVSRGLGKAGSAGPHIPLRDLVIGRRQVASMAGGAVSPPADETRTSEASPRPTGTSIGEGSS
jgi:hypothetical protein